MFWNWHFFLLQIKSCYLRGSNKRTYKPEWSHVGTPDPELGQIKKYHLSNIKSNSKEKEKEKNDLEEIWIYLDW